SGGQPDDPIDDLVASDTVGPLKDELEARPVPCPDQAERRPRWCAVTTVDGDRFAAHSQYSAATPAKPEPTPHAQHCTTLRRGQGALRRQPKGRTGRPSRQHQRDTDDAEERDTASAVHGASVIGSRRDY